MHLWAVCSPEFESQYTQWEPPEWGCAYVEVEARTRRIALSKAIKSPEFEAWVAEARGDRRNPFTGVRARPFHCKHDVCLCYSPDDDAEWYAPCETCYIRQSRLDIAWKVIYNMMASEDPEVRRVGLQLDTIYVKWSNYAVG